MYKIFTIKDVFYVLLMLDDGMTRLVEEIDGSPSWAAYQEWLSKAMCLEPGPQKIIR